MKKIIIKHKNLLLVFSLFLMITSYNNQEKILTEQEKFLEIEKSLNRAEKKVIEINNILESK